MTKDELRKQALLKRDSLDKGRILNKSKKIFEKLIALLPYKEAENILIYVSMRSEVITDEIILDALLAGKKVFCPKVVDRKMGLMEFIKINSLEDLTEGYFGIREPFLDPAYVEPPGRGGPVRLCEEPQRGPERRMETPCGDRRIKGDHKPGLPHAPHLGGRSPGNRKSHRERRP